MVNQKARQFIGNFVYFYGALFKMEQDWTKALKSKEITMGTHFNFQNVMHFWVKPDTQRKNKLIAAPLAVLVKSDYILWNITHSFASLL